MTGYPVDSVAVATSKALVTDILEKVGVKPLPRAELLNSGFWILGFFDRFVQQKKGAKMEIMKKKGQWGTYDFGSGFSGPEPEEDRIRRWAIANLDRRILDYAKQNLACACLALDVLSKIGDDFCEYVMDLIDAAYN